MTTPHTLKFRRALTAAATLTALLILVTACGKDDPMPTMSRADAETRVETHIQQAAAQLTPTPRLEIRSKNEIPCTEPGAANDGDTYAIEHTYLLPDHPKTNNPQALNTLRAYWTNNGYTHDKDEHDTTGTLTGTSAKHTTDHFFVRLWHNPTGDLYLTASSTCLSD